MGTQTPKIICKLHETPLHKRSNSLQFVVNKDLHLSPTKWCGLVCIGQNEVNAAEKLTKKYISNAHAYLDSICMKLFNLAFIYKMLNDLFNSINSLKDSSKCSKFIFTPDYKIDISLVLCSFAYNMFKEAKDIMKKENDPTEILDTLKKSVLEGHEID